MAVNEKDVATMHPFFSKHSFESAGDMIPSTFGITYCYYFWSENPLTLNKHPDGQFSIKPNTSERLRHMNKRFAGGC